LPDVAKFGDGKKAKCDPSSIFSLKPGKKNDEDFTDFTFKEGNTAVVPLKDIYIDEKGKDTFNKKFGDKKASSVSAPKVKGGVKRKAKMSAKAKGKAATPGEIRQKVGKVLKYTPSKTLITTRDSPSKGKASTAGKKSTSGKKYTPAMPSPGGK